MTIQKQQARGAGWRRALPKIASVAALALAGAAVGYGAASLGELAGANPSLSDGQGLALLALILPLTLLGILAHELGHLAGGRLAGFRFMLLVVGPLKLQRYGERVRLGLNRSLALSGGLAASVPTDDRDLRRRMLLMVAGGPAASLLGGALGLAAAALADGLLAGALFAFGAVSLALALATLLPLRTSGFYSDGARILMLLRGGPAADRWCAAVATANTSMSARPREVSPALIARAAALPDGSLDDVGARLIAYMAALDGDDIVSAGGHLDYVLAHRGGYPAAVRPALLLEGAYYLARHRGDPAGARALLDQSGGGALIEPYTRHRAAAAVLLAEGRADEAGAIARAGLESLARVSPGPSGSFEHDLLRDLLGRAGVQ
jgi:hypothetical protein